MMKNWDTYGRQGIDLASAATSFGFSAVKIGTKLGVSECLGNVVTFIAHEELSNV